MTRTRDLYMHDIFDCDHKPTIPIAQDGEIVYWRCTCGKKKVSVTETPTATEEKKS